jgi:hypothetical protein
MKNMTDEEKKEEAKRRAIILMTLKEGYKPKDEKKIIKVKEPNKTPKNYGKLLNKKKW